MKKIILSIAGVMAATAFAPEASAIPAFARQTGMACSACHQQHFPVLNGFGQAFKSAGYTMMGSQGKVEGEHLSIPDTLNASMLFKLRYQDTNGTNTTGVAAGAGTTNGGQWQIPDEFALLIGGRVGETMGFIFEGNLVSTGALVANLKVPLTFDMGGTTLLAIPFTSDGLGVSYGFELSSAGAQRNQRWSEHAADVSAHQFVGFNTPATGVVFAAKNDMGFINYTRWSPTFSTTNINSATGTVGLKSNYLRIAATPTIGDWATVIGAGFMSGASITNGGLVAAGAYQDTRGTFFDAQAHGQVGGKDLGLYATYATAPASVATATNIGNIYNAGTLTRSAWTIGADYSVIPHALHIGAAYRNGDTGVADAAGANQTDNSYTVQAIYDLTMNVALHLAYSKRSGSSYNVGGANGPAVVGGPSNGNALTTFLMEAAW